MHDLQRELGLDAEWLAGSACRRLEPGLAPRVAGGILARADHQVAPRALIAALASAFTAAGGELRRGVRMLGLETGPEGVEAVLLEGGDRLAARAVVLAAGAESGRLEVPEAARVPVRPVKGQILRLARPSRCAAAGRAGDPHSRGLRGAARGRQAGGRRDGRGAGLRRVGHGRRSARAAAAGLRSAARNLRAGAGRGAGGPAARCPRQRADRGRERGRRARVGHRSLAQRDPARADHRRGGRRAPCRRGAAAGVRSLFTAALRDHAAGVAR